MTAPEIAGELQRQILHALTRAGHGACRFADQGWYDPATQSAQCGCQNYRVQFTPDGSTALAHRPQATPTEHLPQAADPIQATLALIDPSQQYSPVDLEKRLLDVLARLEVGALAERAAIDEYYQAKVDFDRKFAQAVNASEKGAADTRKYDAMVKCDAEYVRLVTAEHAMKALKETMHNLRGILSGYQSVTRSVGLDYQAGGAVR